MRDWTKSPLPEPGVPGTNRRCRGRCRTGPRMPGTEPGSQRECSARNGGAGDRDRERRGRCGAGPVGPGRGCGWCRECGGWRRPPPRASGAGAGPRAARPAPAAVPPRRRPGAAGGASADRPSMEGTRRALLRLAAACCLLCALPGTGAGRPRGTGAARGRGGGSPPGLAAPGSGRRGSAGTPGLLRPLVGLREEGLGSPPRARKPPGSGASGLVPKLGRSAHGPGRSRPGAAPVRSPGDARRGAGGGGGRREAGEPRSQGSSEAARPGLARTRQLQAALAPRALLPRRRSRAGFGSPAQRGTRGDARGGEQRARRRSPTHRHPALRALCLPPCSSRVPTNPPRSFPPRGPRTKPELRRLPAGTGRPVPVVLRERRRCRCPGRSRRQTPAPGSLSQAVFRLGSMSNTSPRGQAQSAAWR